jgi:TonB-linked SusC/RagA family outer membrane protein
MSKILRLILLVAVVFSAGKAIAQRAVTGRVTSSEDGSGLPGVNVLVKGTSNGTITDAEGAYSIQVSEGSTLVFSFIGYASVEVVVGTQSTIDVQMASDAQQLNEVVVTGYTEGSKRSITGTINTVSAKAIQDVPMASIDQILQGRAPGVLVLGSSGQPGSAANVTIRGRGSISASTTPLYVLDGVPIDATSFNSLNPNDYEVVSILTDASATSIYGSRAANGVILLNSKKGKGGKTTFGYNTQVGVSFAPENKLKLMNSNEKIDFELLTGGSALEDLSDAELDELRRINTDWAEELFQNGAFQSHELSARGGNENTTFYISGAYLKQEGTVRQTLLERYTGRMNLNHESGKFRFGLNTTFGFSKNEGTREGDAFIGSPLNAVRWANPYEKPYNDDGSYTEIRTGQPNPLQELLENKRKRNDLKIVGSMNLAYDLPIKGLTVKTTFGVDYGQQDFNFYLDRSTYQGDQATGEQGSLTRAYNYDARFINTNAITYATTFGEDHSLTAGLYQETNYRQVKGFQYTGYGLTGNLKNEGGITVSDEFLPLLGGNNSESGLSSLFADVRYGYQDRYHLSLGLRRDGSSRFGTGNKYANFYAIGANWIISDEAFFTALSNKINMLKFNVSFGTSGNQEGIADFQSRELYATFPYDGQNGVGQVQLPNPDLKWETQKMFDVSLEYGVLNNRITGKFGFYNRLTEDLLFNVPLSQTTGYTSVLKNVGSLRNRGVEISVSADVVRTTNFSWNLSANFTYNKNEVVEIYGGLDELPDPNDFLVLKVGKPIGTNYMVEYAGVNPANGDPLYRRPDGSLTSEFSSSDLQTWGTRFAPRFGGFTNTLTYKGLELSVFFTWVHGNEVYNNDRTNVENPTYYVDQMAKSMLRAWKQPGDITDVPRVATVDGLTTAEWQAQTTRYLEDGSFLRLRNVILSYTLPQSILGRTKLSNVRVFVQGQNLWTKTEFLGWDPELASGTLIGAQYPALRTITGGLNIGF